MVDYNSALWFITRLTGSADTVIDWRCIHDKRKDLPAHNFRGTLAEIFPTLQDYNQREYGIFCLVNATDGLARELSNVTHIRAHMVDLDNRITAKQNYELAAGAGASFAVQTSPEKYHVYWRVQPYVGNDFFTLIQRKLAQAYDGDKKIIDATRVMRVPGFYHQKNEPSLVQGWDLPNVGTTWSHADMENNLAHVNVIEFMATRSKLGSVEMQAPSLDWLKFAISLVDPNDMDRSEWLSFSAAIKQSGWNHATPEELLEIWNEWCDRYEDNDRGENLKLWNSINDTEVGWKSIERRSTVKAYMMFGHKEPPKIGEGAVGSFNPVPQQPDLTNIKKAQEVSNQQDQFGEIMTEYDCQEYFKDCFFVNRTGEIFSQAGRFMNSTKFNGRYGGKQFIITSTGKLTDEPWKAALRSTCWTIPKVDHIRFLPDKKPFEVIEDDLGREGLNTYIPAKVQTVEGDVSLWLDHVKKILPDEGDRKLLFDYMAHNVKYPGYKIPWSPMLQSAEGIGKSIFVEVMQKALGNVYVYTPKAPELVKSGSTFNAWMRAKLMIMVNEIKIDERRELIEILKPMISDKEVEVQSKGVDQEMEDNPANWFFFSNYKDAIPINKNGRRYSIFYSCLQSEADILNAGMNDEYFDKLFNWLRDDNGFEKITNWFMNYPVKRGQIPMRAPKTSSHDEALRISRSPMEVVIQECIDDGLCGFRGGYVSTIAVIQRSKASGIRSPNTRTVQACLEGMGYVSIGRSPRAFMQEDVNNRTELFSLLSSSKVEDYGKAQGYE